MRDSTLTIVLFFILALVYICFYWSFYFFGPLNSAPCNLQDTALLLAKKEHFKTHRIPESAIWEDTHAESGNKDGDDEAGTRRTPRVKGIMFPPDRIPIEYEVNQSVWEKSVKEFMENKPEIDFSRMHFVHVPKAGGTSLNILLRQMMCERDPEENKDCCVPGICYKKRRCDVMVGCYGHLPNRCWTLLLSVGCLFVYIVLCLVDKCSSPRCRP